MDTLKIIENELIEVGINPCNSGFYYLIHAINFYLENNKEFYEVSITKELYPYVSSKKEGEKTWVRKIIHQPISTRRRRC